MPSRRSRATIGCGNLGIATKNRIRISSSEIFVGFAARGTLAPRIVDGASEVDI